MSQVNSKPAPPGVPLAPSPAPPAASLAPSIHPSFHNPLGQTNPSLRRPQGATISPLPAPASAGNSYPATAPFVASSLEPAQFVANSTATAHLMENSTAPTNPTVSPSPTSSPAQPPVRPAPKPQQPEEITLDDDDEAAPGGEVKSQAEVLATPLQLVVNKALAGGAGIVVQWNKRSMAAMFDFSQVLARPGPIFGTALEEWPNCSFPCQIKCLSNRPTEFFFLF